MVCLMLIITKLSSMKSEDVKDKSKKSELKKVLQLVLVILLGTGLITWIYHWQHSKVNSLSKQVSALQSQSASGVVKEQSVVENEEGGAPEGYELKSNKYFSFYWPKAWEDPEVKNEPASTVVGQRYSEDIVYNQDKSLWEEAGTYKSVEQPTQIKFTRTTKKGFGLSREEIEEEIDQPEFEHLIQSTKFLAFRTGKPPQIHKIRTTAEIGSLTLEIDRYLGPELGGLCVTEIEFPDRNKALSFNTKEDIPSGILSQELDPVIFGNAQLALSGKIPEGIILPGYLRSA